MRAVLFGAFFLSGTLYAAGTAFFWSQERAVESLPRASRLAPSRLLHPEATLGLIRSRMADDDYSESVGALVDSALDQVPASYQPHSLLAAYHSSRLEAPDRVREGFEEAIARFGANGRLHLDYARWLLMAPSVTFDVERRSELAESHVRRALALEPELTPAALSSLARYGVPPGRWASIVPADRDARRGMVLALAGAGHKPEATAELRRLLAEETMPRFQRQAAQWALLWDDPGLALDAVLAWKAHGGEGPEPYLLPLYEIQARLRLGQFDAAYEGFRQALEELGPRSSSGLKLLCGAGEEYVSQSRLVLAESIFMEALSYSPSYVCALLGTARVHRRQGDRLSAAQYYERVLELEPDHEVAKNELLRLMAAR